ncbi:methylamine utilization protein [Aestuariibacter halophilus]|uniref:Methylamine utilization protein n=1 Tax=Fluctibacter halophilus TaxID=226011 RepID=A0ABS8GAM8_9ALTE|nr:methylamine utilization protein [Aestuariibacter halophilus]MCC2617592.1 methylamine utilization protein [Aestuariibacter halophilus]
MTILSVIIPFTVQRICRTLVVCLLTSVSMNLAAKQVQIVDQHGQPVQDAVVSYADTLPATPLPMAVMDQVDKQFLPHVLVINKGQQVAFPNSDNVRHHVYSFSAPKPFEIKLFSGTEAAPVAFDKPGIVVLGCNIHDQMIGFIYVADQETALLTNTQGRVDVPDTLNEVYVWHERLSSSQTVREKMALVDGQPLQVNLVAEKVPEKTSKTFGSRFGKGN